MRPCFVPAAATRCSSISFVLACHFIISFLVLTAEAHPVQSSAHITYSNDGMSIHHLADKIRHLAEEESNGEPPSDASDTPSFQLGEGAVNQTDITLTFENKQPVVTKEWLNETKVTPSFGAKRCGECKVNIDSINIKKAKLDLRRTRDTFLLDYEAGLKPMHCPTSFDSNRCSEEIATQQLALRAYKLHTNQILGSLDTFDCIISLNQPEQQSCPVEVFVDQRASNATTDTSQEHDLDYLDALAAEEISFEETRELTRVVRSAQAALDAIDELMNSLFEFGGESAGRVCSIATSIAKGAFSETKVQLLMELNGAQYILTEREVANDGASKFLLRQNYKVTKAVLGEVTAVYQEVIELNKEMGVRLSKLSCPFGKFGLKSKLQRQGCDGVDQNCDGKVDECAEDQVPPTITMTQPMPTTAFADVKSARDFLESHITVTDDCAAEIDTDIVLLDDPRCSSCKFAVRASDKRCYGGFQTTGLFHDSAYSELEFVLPVLSKKKKDALSIKCGFSQSTDKSHVKDGSYDSCKENMASFVPDGDSLELDQKVLKRKVDIGFWYDMDASKKDGIIDVDIVVKSNELEGQSNDNAMAFVAVRNPTSKGNAQAMVFLEPTTCQDGFSHLSPCVAEETTGVTTRIYDIEITGTGADGVTDTTTCRVIVVPQNHHDAIKDIAGGIAAGETGGASELISSGKNYKKSSKIKSGEKSKKRRAVRQRGLQEGDGLKTTASNTTLQDEDGLWYPPTNAPSITYTIETAPTPGSPTTVAPTSSPAVDPVVLQKIEDDKDVLYKQYKLSKWRFEVGRVSFKYDPKFDTGIKNVEEQERGRRVQDDVAVYTLLEYNPLCLRR